MHIDLTGKRALVTGASRGIGEAIAITLDAAGAQVVLHYNKSKDRTERIASRLTNTPICIQADLADPTSCATLFQQTLAGLGRLDILVNNAGIAIDASPDATMDHWLNAWNTTMAVNLRASELLSRLAIKHFLTQQGGRIINIASRAAFRGDTPGYMTYAASKAGMVAVTKSIARAYGKNNIMAFVIAPGFTRTDMAQEFIDLYGEEHALGDIALQRLTEPNDIAPMVVLLASGLADHATGTSIDVNAGSYVH